MSTKKETERSKLVQEKCQTLITQMLKDEDNKYCVDCDAKGPRWASWNLGVFLCIRCAGIHRNLGVHITRVKSVNLDTWTPEQVVSLQQMGNSRARAVYEAQLPDGFRRPQTDAALESFIRAKYEQKKYVAKEWVPSPLPKVDWEKEIDEELERQKRKKKSLAAGSGSAILGSLPSPSASAEKKAPVSKPTPIPAPLPKPKSSAHSPKTGGRAQLELSSNNNGSSSNGGGSNTLDLLGLSSPPTASGTSSISSSSGAPPSTSTDPSNGGGAASDDEFNNFFSANSATRSNGNAENAKTTTTGGAGGGLSTEPKSLAQEEADFFNQSVPSDAEKAKLTKDSIMALYGSQPAVQATPLVASGAPTSNLSLLAGLGNVPAAGQGGMGFPGQFQNGGFPTQSQQAAGQVPQNNGHGLNHHFGGLSLGGPVNQQPQFAQMQSQFMNGVGGGGFNQHQFNGQGHQQGGGMNFFPAGGMGGGGFPQTNPLMAKGFNGQMPQMQQGGHPQMMMGGGGGGGMMATNGGQFHGFGMPGAPAQGTLLMGGQGTTNGAGQPQNQASQFGNLNLGNVWQ